MLIKQESRTAPQEHVQANSRQNRAAKDKAAVEAEHREGKTHTEQKDGSSCLCVIKGRRKN